MKLSLFLILFALPTLSHAAESRSWSYMDYEGEKHTVTLNVANETVTSLNISGFEGAIKLPGEDQASYYNPKVEEDVKSTSKSGGAIWGLMLQKDNANISELRNILNKLHESGSVQFSGDELCPEASERLLHVVYKDVPFSFAYCLIKN
jgi:hypothetical protein